MLPRLASPGEKFAVVAASRSSSGRSSTKTIAPPSGAFGASAVLPIIISFLFLLLLLTGPNFPRTSPA